MPPLDHVPVVNRLLDTLPSKAAHRIRQEGERVELSFGEILCEPGEPIRDVCFPEESFISLVATVDGRSSLEVGLIGNEGMLGVPLVLGVEQSSLRAVVQGGGSALRMQARHFRRVLADNPDMRNNLDQYVHVLMTQLAQTVVCTRFHVLDARLARWLLMTHDRAHADHFYLTHALLASMLGVRRSGITTAAGLLQQRGLIDYGRGNITILDRRGLERASCDCYRIVTAAYDGLSRTVNGLHRG